jgi:hypothetical protein
MTSHAYDAWADGNIDPDERWGQTDCGRNLDAAVATLRDIVSLTEEGLPAATVADRVQAIARACLSRLGIPVPPAVEDLGEPCGQCFPDDPTF